jgi:hypothetical protein
VANKDHYVFEVNRKDGRPKAKILYSDAYHFGEADQLVLPDGIDFVLVMPNSDYDTDIRRALAEDGIGIGRYGKLLPALNFHQMWKFRFKEEIKIDHDDGFGGYPEI